jgi:hypothetical protein
MFIKELKITAVATRVQLMELTAAVSRFFGLVATN